MSPTLHNTGFQTLGLPHSYYLHETSDWTKVKSEMEKPDVFGASITIPLKIDVLNNGIVTDLSDSARIIGAVNTLAKTSTGIYGHNTDWLGIQQWLRKFAGGEAVGLVIGAGGTARAALYALKHLPFVTETLVWNRTSSKAVQLAKEFDCQAIDTLSISGRKSKQLIVIGTIPASAQSAMQFDVLFTNFSSGVVLDMAYRPRITLLLEQATKNGWDAIEGIQVLLEQGYEQFELWTSLPAPKHAIASAVMNRYNASE
jgi:pentafunctional AROM polypeptide